ncbi:MAG TPA: hypothetical protein VNR61_05920 [Niallia sp.]|nr:hypothetical protein [Niallia sp.]
MFLVFVVLIFAIIIVWLLVDSLYFAKPPKPLVVCDGKLIPTTIGSNCWKGSLRGTCVDYVYESAWEMGLASGSVFVEPNSSISIEFNKTPLSGSLQVAEVDKDGEEEFIDMEGNTFHTPTKQGIYVYMIYANWEQGNPNYAFSIKIR